MNQPAPEYPSDGTPADDVPQPIDDPRAEQAGTGEYGENSTPLAPYKDDTSDGTTAPRASDVASAEDLEPADATPAEQGDDTGVDHEGNDLEPAERVSDDLDEQAEARAAVEGEQA